MQASNNNNWFNTLQQQLKLLGYQPNDRVYFRGILPKRLSTENAFIRGLAYKNKKQGDRLVRMTREFYLDNGKLWQKQYGQYKPVELDALKKANDQGFGLYMVINPGGESDKDITEARVLFYECDDISKEEQWHKVKELEKQLGISLIVIETAKSLHVYIKLIDAITNLDKWKEYQLRLIERQKSDKSIHNPARLMRVAGFDHKDFDSEKNDFISTPVVLRQFSDQSVAISEVDEILPFLPEPEVKAIGTHGGFTVHEGTNVNGVSMLDLAEYQEGWNPSGRNGWGTFQCPVHVRDSKSHSDSHIHVNLLTGAFKAHCGCLGTLVWNGSLTRAVERGYKAPATQLVVDENGKKVKPKKNRKKYTQLYRAFKGLGNYVPTQIQNNSQLILPELTHPIEFVSSACKTGKTTALIEVVKSWMVKGGRVVWNTYRNALAYQTCEKAGIPHIHQFNSDSDRVSYAQAFACCPDSLHLMQIISIKEPVLFVIDEADATLAHILNGETMGEEHERKLQHFRLFCKRVIAMGGRIVLMEDSLTHVMIDAWRKIIGEDVSFGLTVNEKYISKWKVKQIGAGSSTGQSSQIQRDIARGLNVAIVSDSQQHIESLERTIKNNNSESKGIRIDSTTAADEFSKDFMKSPDQVIEEFKPQYIMLSPTAESGVSITSKHIDRVYAYFTHSTPRQMIQMLERVRTDVDRFIYCKDWAVDAYGIKYCNPENVLNKLRTEHLDTIQRSQLIARQKQFNESRGTGEFDEVLLNLRLQEHDEDHKIFNEAYSFFKARENAAKACVLENLIEELIGRDIEIELLEDWQHDQGMALDLSAAKHEMGWDKACEVAGADFSIYTEKELKQLAQSNSLNREDAAIVKKWLLSEALPGYDLDTPESVDYVLKGHGKNKRKVTEFFHGLIPQIARARDAAYHSKKLKRSSLQMLHRNPNYSKRAELLHILQSIKWYCLENVYTSTDETIIGFSNLLADNAEEIRELTGLKMEYARPALKDTNGNVIRRRVNVLDNIHALLRFEGLKPQSRGRLGGRDDRRRYYQAVMTEDFQNVLAALLEKYKEEIAKNQVSWGVSMVFNRLLGLLKTMDTNRENLNYDPQISNTLLKILEELTPIPIAV